MEKKRIAYLCPTILSLTNSIVAQMTVNKGIPADVVLEDATDFENIKAQLSKCGVFEHIYDFKASKAKLEYKKLSSFDKKAVDRKPSKLFPIPQFENSYTDFCTHIDSYASKFLYYGMLEKGMRPAVHFVSEGTGTYALNFLNTKQDGMDHRYYGENAFLKKVKNIYVYEPELYSGKADFVSLIQLPKYDAFQQELKDVIRCVFGESESFDEKLIFFEGTFWGDGLLVNEMDLFLAIAKYIGKENIIVKRHPRNAVDRFTPLGFKVMSKQSVPWEVMIKDIDLENKALVSVASFTCFSSMEMYGKISRAILLENLMRGKVYFLEDEGYKRFFRKAEKYFNKNQIVSWRPQSIRELYMALDVIGEKIGGWK